MQVVLHGTNGFPADIMQKCIKHGVTRINVNKLVLDEYYAYTAEYTGKVPQTELIAKGTELTQKACELWMDRIGSSGKA